MLVGNGRFRWFRHEPHDIHQAADVLLGFGKLPGLSSPFIT